MSTPEQTLSAIHRTWEEPPVPTVEEQRAEEMADDIDQMTETFYGRTKWMAEAVIEGNHWQMLRDLFDDMKNSNHYREQLKEIARVCAEVEVERENAK